MSLSCTLPATLPASKIGFSKICLVNEPTTPSLLALSVDAYSRLFALRVLRSHEDSVT
jgi:hypothetical protein